MSCFDTSVPHDLIFCVTLLLPLTVKECVVCSMRWKNVHRAVSDMVSDGFTLMLQSDIRLDCPDIQRATIYVLCALTTVGSGLAAMGRLVGSESFDRGGISACECTSWQAGCIQTLPSLVCAVARCSICVRYTAVNRHYCL